MTEQCSNEHDKNNGNKMLKRSGEKTNVEAK